MSDHKHRALSITALAITALATASLAACGTTQSPSTPQQSTPSSTVIQPIVDTYTPPPPTPQEATTTVVTPTVSPEVTAKIRAYIDYAREFVRLNPDIGITAEQVKSNLLESYGIPVTDLQARGIRKLIYQRS